MFGVSDALLRGRLSLVGRFDPPIRVVYPSRLSESSIRAAYPSRLSESSIRAADPCRLSESSLRDGSARPAVRAAHRRAYPSRLSESSIRSARGPEGPAPSGRLIF